MTEARPTSDTVTLVNLTKRYGATRALDGVSLSVAQKQIWANVFFIASSFRADCV